MLIRGIRHRKLSLQCIPVNKTGLFFYAQINMLTKGKHLGKLILRSNYKLLKLLKWSKYNIRIWAPPPPSKLCWLFKPGLGVFKSDVFLNGLSAIYTNLSIHAKFPSWHTPVKTSQKQYKYYNKLVQPQTAQFAGRIFMYNHGTTNNRG